MTAKTKVVKLPVTTRALVQRLNRRLHDDELVLRKTRSRRAWIDLGDFYLVNWRINGVVRYRVDLEELGREVGVLANWERWDDSSQ
jgi:hypothetical protein